MCKVVTREPITAKRTTRSSSKGASGSGSPKRRRVVLRDEEEQTEEETVGSDEERTEDEAVDQEDHDEVEQVEDDDVDEEETVPRKRKRSSVQFRNRATDLSPYENVIDGDTLEELKKGPFWPLFDAFYGKSVTPEMTGKDNQQIHQICQHFVPNDKHLLIFRFGDNTYQITDDMISQILGLPLTGERAEDIEVDPEVQQTLKELFVQTPLQITLGETSAAAEKKKGKKKEGKKKKGKNTKGKNTKGKNTKGKNTGKVRVTRSMVEAAIARVGHNQPTDDLGRAAKTRTMVRLLCVLICSDFLLSNVSCFISDGLLRAVFGEYEKIAWAVEVRVHLHTALKRLGSNSGGCVELILVILLSICNYLCTCYMFH